MRHCGLLCNISQCWRLLSNCHFFLILTVSQVKQYAFLFLWEAKLLHCAAMPEHVGIDGMTKYEYGTAKANAARGCSWEEVASVGESMPACFWLRGGRALLSAVKTNQDIAKAPPPEATTPEGFDQPAAGFQCSVSGSQPGQRFHWELFNSGSLRGE